MAFSSLTGRTMRTNKSSSRFGRRVTRVIVHHWAGTAGGVQRLVYSKDQASANYIILLDGTLIGSVPESRRAWTSGSAAADRPSITVEIQNETGAPAWRVSAASVDTLTRLIADVAKRYKWGRVTRSRVRGHREFQATACPGPYLYPRLASIAAAAERVRSGGGVSKPSTGKLATDGYWGKATTRRAQTVAGTPVDGIVSSQERAYRRTNPGLTSGWYWVRRPKGSQFIARLQSRLRKQGRYGGRLDGIAGPQFWRAFQSAMGTPIDGRVSKRSQAVSQFQRNLNNGKIW